MGWKEIIMEITARNRNQNVRGKQLINDKQSGDCMELVEKSDVSEAMFT